MSISPGPPESVRCFPLPAFDTTNLHDARGAFHGASPIPLTQAWLDEPEPDFEPATVRTGWRGESLFVFAELTDADVFTKAAKHNQRFWELGDTFEMFLQPGPDRPYVELHVTPNNLRLQLRFANPPSPGAGGDSFGSALIDGEAFRSSAWLLPPAREWCVLAEIPAELVQGSAAMPPGLAGAHWRFSFCRYDYTRGRARPVISSSSRHTAPRFHQPHEWGRLHAVE